VGEFPAMSQVEEEVTGKFAFRNEYFSSKLKINTYLKEDYHV